MSQAPGSRNVHVTGRRVVATLVDAVIFGVPSSVFASFSGTESAPSGFDLTTLWAGGSIWWVGAVVLYYVLLEGLTGRTIGKLVTGIRVVSLKTGGRPGIVSALVRTLLRLIDGLFCYLVGLLIVVNSDGRRRLGDMAAETLVVRA